MEKIICKKAVLLLQNFAKHVADGCVQLKSGDGSVAKELREKYALKLLHAKAAEVFNNKPKEIEGFLVEHGLLPAEHSREDLARQVRRINGLHKKRLGEWLAKLGNEDIAKAFIADLDFRGRRIDDAMRLMLATFRLPGESQEINRLMEAFAPVLYEQCRSEPTTRDIFASVDSVYIMAYSVIMLNTDQHNPQYKGRRMTEEDFIRNNRGNNEGSDYDREFLRSVYHAIRNNEILMPEEHEGDTAFNHRYSETVNVAMIHYPTERESVGVDLVGGELLPMLWDQCLHAVADLFELQLQVMNDVTVSRAAVKTLHSLAVAAGALNQPDRMDELIMSVWTCSNIEKFFKSTSGTFQLLLLINNQYICRKCGAALFGQSGEWKGIGEAFGGHFQTPRRSHSHRLEATGRVGVYIARIAGHFERVVCRKHGKRRHFQTIHGRHRIGLSLFHCRWRRSRSRECATRQ